MKKQIENSLKINQKYKKIKLPTTNELESELYKEKYKFKYKSLIKSTIYTLITVVAISSLIAVFLLPVLKIYGKSMEPSLINSDIIVCIKKSEYKSGDIIAFYYNNHILVKRIIATTSQWVEIESDGAVYVNDKLLKEEYIKEKCLGKTDITYPYQVSENSYFVLGDERASSLDSRNREIGTISKEEIIGKLIFRVWPLNRFGIVK